MMSKYITADDLQDEALKDIVQDEDFTYAESEFEDFVTTRLLLTVADIVVPVKPVVVQYILAILYEHRAELSVGIGNRMMGDKDLYAYKQYQYSKKIASLEARITQATITGNSATAGSGSPSISIFRG